MKNKRTKPIRFEVITPAERHALRQTGNTGTVRLLARECDMAFGKFQTLREAESRIKAEADAAWTRVNALMSRLVKAVEAEDLAAAKHARKAK